LLNALADAAATTDPDSARYALGCIQLQGDSGKVVATDGRQLLVQSDFAFGWEDNILIPASRLFGSKRLADDESVLVGRDNDWFTLRTGPWTFWLMINVDGRFPEVESHIGRVESAVASVEMPAADRRFLAENLPRLPGDDHFNLPVTVDLNGSVAVRGKQTDQPHATELILTASTRTGEPIRLNTNREFLQRAVTLGFERLHVFSNRSPVLACDQRRQYVWALLDPKSSIDPDENAVRIESPAANIAKPRPRQPRRRKARPTLPKTDRRMESPNGHSSSEHSKPREQPCDVIEQAKAMEAALREAANTTRALVRQLKQERKQPKAAKAALQRQRQAASR